MNIMRLGALIVIFFMLTLRVENVPETEAVEVAVVPETPKKEKIVVKGGIREFMRTMSRIESDNTHDVVNRFGMMGKYQFSPKTVASLGFNVTQDEFLNNPSLQDQVMIVFMRTNKKALRNLIKNYHGKVVNNVLVTEAGILAGAHLVGPGGVLAFFYPEKYNFKTVDGNGTNVAYYMNKFKHYDLSGL